MKLHCLASLLLALALAGCAAAPPAADPTPTVTAVPTSEPTALLPTAAAAPTAAPTAAPRSYLGACSPLDGFSLAELPALVSNPYHPPKPGSDDPHYGVDLADAQNPQRMALPGRGVRALLQGKVAAVIPFQFPYGYGVIIETPLDALPPGWAGMELPQPQRTPPPGIALSCPPFDVPAGWDFSRPSLYLLYAHMDKAANYLPGNPVTCGQELGKVGQTGNALNPHLHLEARIGPGGAQLGSMSHYDDSATLSEMATYCAWRVSGLFQTIDALLPASLPPEQ